MLNALIQLGTFAYGLVLNFLAPMVFGLTAYGEFIAFNALAFLLHRAMTILSEPLIGLTPPAEILANSLVLNACVLLAFTLVHAMHPLGSPVLLAGILMSMSCLLAMQAMKKRRAYIAFIASVTVLFVALMLWSRMHGFSLTLTRVMELSSWIPSMLCIGYLFANGATLPKPDQLQHTLALMLRQVPRLMSMTAVMNLLTSALPLFLAPVLIPRDLGLFKVMMSVIQSATTVFPVSTQALLAAFVQHKRGADLYRLVSSVATLYFALACIVLTTLALVVPMIAPYVALAACLPVYYHAILIERHMTATGQIKSLITINLCVMAAVACALVFVDSLPHAAMLYAAGFALYGFALSLAERDFPPAMPLTIALAASPFAVVVMLQHPWVGIPYGILVAVTAGHHHAPTRKQVRLLWREL